MWKKPSPLSSSNSTPETPADFMDAEDLTVADDRQFERALRDCGDGSLDAMAEAYDFWHAEEANAAKRCRLISARMDQIRGS